MYGTVAVNLITANIWDVLFDLLLVVTGAAISIVAAYFQSRRDQNLQINLDLWPKKLEVHQQAFFIWRRCCDLAFHSVSDHEKQEITKQAISFWEENCLYVSEQLRRDFHAMIFHARDHAGFIKGRDAASSQKMRRTLEPWG